MILNALGFLLVIVGMLAFLILRQMVARRVRRAVLNSSLGRNRTVQYLALGVVVLYVIGSLGAVSVVFFALFLVVGGFLKVRSLFRATPASEGMRRDSGI